MDQELRDLGRDIRDALTASHPPAEIRAVAQRFIVRSLDGWSDDDGVARLIAERLDAGCEDPERCVQLAADMDSLIRQASSVTEVGLLMELVAERMRVVEVAEKYRAGPISRTGFLSYVSEQRWPQAVRRRLAALSDGEIDGLVTALRLVDIRSLSKLVLGEGAY